MVEGMGGERGRKKKAVGVCEVGAEETREQEGEGEWEGGGGGGKGEGGE